MKTKFRRIIFITLAGVMILALILVFAGAIAKANLAKQYPAPGQLVDVGGYKMHIHCIGQGYPTVILEAGLGDFSITWDKVQGEVAKTMRVCSYDRAGYGWSEPSPDPLTASRMAEELHTLLVNADLHGPYVLVGHSLGGLVIRVFTHNYPDEVVGMVLVDSTHEEQYIRLSAAVPEFGELLKRSQQQGIGQNRFFGFLSSTGFMALLPQVIPNPGFQEDVFDQYKAIWAATSYFETMVAETDAMDEILADTRAMRITSFGKLPLIVLSAGLTELIPGISDGDNQKIREIQQLLQSDLLTLSSNSKQLIAEHSSHYIQSDQPDLVIDAIREIVHIIQE